MCGIFCSAEKDKFLELYESNKERGDFSFGSLFVGNDIHTYKTQKVDTNNIPDIASVYLGHTRAPTIAQDKPFDANESHPFQCGDWVVGHNGIIKNFNKLKDYYKYEGEVDSGIIPHILYMTGDIATTLGMLEGIFGLWIYNRSSKRIWIARCACTLYYNEQLNYVSSKKILEEDIMLKEGTLYEWSNYANLKECNSFRYNSPFLFL